MSRRRQFAPIDWSKICNVHVAIIQRDAILTILENANVEAAERERRTLQLEWLGRYTELAAYCAVERPQGRGGWQRLSAIDQCMKHYIDLGSPDITPE